MAAALSKLPHPDAPLRKLAPSGGWIEQQPTAYSVRAQHAEDALNLAVYCHHVLGGHIPRKYAGRVARSQAELSHLPELRTFEVLVGIKPGPQRGQRWLSTEIMLIEEEVPDAPQAA